MTTTTKIILLVLGLVLLAGVGHGITGSTRPVMSSSRYAW